MKKIVGFVLFGALALFPLACADDMPVSPTDSSPTLAEASTESPVPGFDFEYTGHYIVGYTGYDMPSEATELIADAGGSLYRQWPEIGYGEMGAISEDDAEELRNVDGITSVTPDIRIRWIPSSEANFEEAVRETLEAPETESDQSGAFFFNLFQWNMRVIDADAAWLVTNQGAGTKIAVLDTGVDPFHLDLAGKIDGASTSVLSPGSSPCGPFDETTFFDLNFHGSFVSGLVSSNGFGMASVAPDASIIGVKVLNCFGFGSFGDVANGIIYAANNSADVINMSLGALLPQDTEDEAFNELIEDLIDFSQDAVDFATDNGVFVVASAGNDALNFDDLPEQGTCPPGDPFPASLDPCDEVDIIHVPSMLDNVLSVGATAPVGQMNFDQLASYTNFGEDGVDVMAPGGDFVAGSVCSFAQGCDLILSVCSVFVCGSPLAYVVSAGTSFAAPHTAGAAAVAIGEGEDADCVQEGAEPIPSGDDDDIFGSGRVNVVGAVQCDALTTDDD